MEVLMGEKTWNLEVVWGENQWTSSINGGVEMVKSDAKRWVLWPSHGG
jgi:hypothetical protein